MNIVNKKIEELIPYENNPRKNEEAVKYVSNSIKEFGFKVPIIIDKNNVAEQIKAFRIADNKVTEKSEWNFELLNKELEDIFDIDMKDFGFDLYDKIRRYMGIRKT